MICITHTCIADQNLLNQVKHVLLLLLEKSKANQRAQKSQLLLAQSQLFSSTNPKAHFPAFTNFWAKKGAHFFSPLSPNYVSSPVPLRLPCRQRAASLVRVTLSW